MLGACGSSAPTSSPRGTVLAFNADLSRHAWAAACALLSPAVVQALAEVDSDAGATVNPNCVAEISARATQRFLTADHATRSEIEAATVTRPAGYGSNVREVSDSGVTFSAGPYIYYVEQSRGRWQILILD
jgi:hypothetical protein